MSNRREGALCVYVERSVRTGDAVRSAEDRVEQRGRGARDGAGLQRPARLEISGDGMHGAGRTGVAQSWLSRRFTEVAINGGNERGRRAIVRELVGRCCPNRPCAAASPPGEVNNQPAAWQDRKPRRRGS